MAVIRVNKTADYTVISNTHFKEKEMSLKAKGLLSMMLSLPDDWDYSIAGLVVLSKDGKDSVMNALTELEQFGYLKRTRLTNEKGQFQGYEYDIYEKPQQGKPNEEEPYAEKPNTANPLQLNTKESNTKKSNTKELNNNISADFETLWEMYPRKLGKTKAFTAYQKAVKAGTTFEDVKKGIEHYNSYIKSNKIENGFIKHGSTWFNGQCWNDEYEVKEQKQEPKKWGGTYV